MPVTILTGFLGSGKTTLLNRILREAPGGRIAVIENELGEIGVDRALVRGVPDEWFEMNNGCICCSVRADLVRILGRLTQRQNRFDHVLIETTGVAAPGPVLQPFFVDDGIRRRFRVNGVIVVVDAVHAPAHLDSFKEVQEQVALADRVVLNKTDLATAAAVDRLQARIRVLNPRAPIDATEYARLDALAWLHPGAFDLPRAFEVDASLLEVKYPFAWAGVFDLSPGGYEWICRSQGPATMHAVLLPIRSRAALAESLAHAVVQFFEPAHPVGAAGRLRPGAILHRLNLKDGEQAFYFEIREAGAYVLFTEHGPETYPSRVTGPAGPMTPFETALFPRDHGHGRVLNTVSLTAPGELDPIKVLGWLQDLAARKGADIFRMKGILSIKGQPQRFVLQGIHAAIEGRPDGAWDRTGRRNALTFVGRGLDRRELQHGLLACLD